MGVVWLRDVLVGIVCSYAVAVWNKEKLGPLQYLLIQVIQGLLLLLYCGWLKRFDCAGV